MKKKSLLSICFFVAALMLFIAPLAFADTLKSTTTDGTYGWQDWTKFDLDKDSRPYWDNASWDGTNKNIGYYLSNSGAFSKNTEGPGTIPFWGTSFTEKTYPKDRAGDKGGAFDPNFYFVKDSDQSMAVMKIEIAGYASQNRFGWYDTSQAFGTGNIHEIFNGEASAPALPTPPSSAFFRPTENYGFYLWSPQDEKYFLTESSKSEVDVGYQHFAVFKESGSETYWIGMEDLKFGKIPGINCNYYDSDKDYNDMVVRISSVPAVPEPATLLLLGLGLVGLAGARRKFRKITPSRRVL